MIETALPRETIVSTTTKSTDSTQRNYYFFLTIFSLWPAIWFRILAEPGLSWPGLVDDLCSAVIIGSLITLQLSLNAFWRLVGICIVGSLTIIFYSASFWHFEFFNSFLNIHSFFTANQLVAAKSSVISLATPTSVVMFFLVPLSILTLLYRYGLYRRSKLELKVSATILVLAISCTTSIEHFRQDLVVPHENNPLLYFVRHWTGQRTPDFSEKPDLFQSSIRSRASVSYNNFIDVNYRSAASTLYPLAKIPTASRDTATEQGSKKNVIIFFMESVRALELGLTDESIETYPAIGHHLREIGSKGLLFPNFYANGTQTVRGEIATLCSILPNFSGPQIYKTYPNLDTYCLPDILREHGYATYWISGFTASFAKKSPFLTSHGIETILDIDAMTNHNFIRPEIGWGPSDLDVIDFALEEFDGTQKPFMAEIMTLSNHHPFHWDFGIPPPSKSRHRGSKHYLDYLNGLHFTDYAAGYLIKEASKRDWFDDTVFVFLGDHSVWTFPAMPQLTAIQKIDTYFKQGLVIYSPKHLKPAKLEVLGSQIDVAPTLLDILDIKEPNGFVGTSLLNTQVPTAYRFALFQTENSWHIRQANQYCYATGTTCFKTMYPLCAKGKKPQPAAHSCFSGPLDLLADGTVGKSFETLSPAERESLLQRGRNLVEINSFILNNRGFFPREPGERREFIRQAKSTATPP